MAGSMTETIKWLVNAHCDLKSTEQAGIWYLHITALQLVTHRCSREMHNKVAPSTVWQNACLAHSDLHSQRGQTRVCYGDP